MYYQLFNDIHTAREIAPVEDRNRKFNQIIDGWEIPFGFKRALQWHWFEEDLNVGPTLHSYESLVKREEKNRFLAQGFISIGMGPNGDDLLVRLSDLSIWFWCHETAKNWETRVIEDCVPLYDHLFILLLHVHNKDFIPWDSFAAKDYHSVMGGK
jgi:hypothetical protein